MDPAQSWLMIFVVLAAAAIVVQMIALIAIAVAAKRTGERVRALAEQVETRGLPVLESLQALLTDTKPKLKLALDNFSENTSKVKPLLESLQATVTETKPKLNLALDNLSETTTKVRAQVEVFDSNFEPLLERVRVQMVRADELVTRIMDRIDFVSQLVERGVKAPATRANGIWQGLSAGLGVLFGKRAPDGGNPVPKDKMFI